ARLVLLDALGGLRLDRLLHRLGFARLLDLGLLGRGVRSLGQVDARRGGARLRAARLVDHRLDPILDLAEAALALLLAAPQLLARRLPELALGALRARLRLAELVLGPSQRAAGLLELGGELGLPFPGAALGLLSRLPALGLDPLLRALLGVALDL